MPRKEEGNGYGRTTNHLCQTPQSQSSASASSRTLLPLKSPRLTAMHISPSSSHVTQDQGLTFWPLLFVVCVCVCVFTLSWVYQGISYTRLFQVYRSVSSDTLCHGVTTIVTIWTITITPSSSSHCLDSKPLLPPPWQHWVNFCPHGFAFSRTSCKWNQSIYSLLCLASLT